MKQYLGMTTAILALGLAMPALAQDDAAQDQQTDQPQPSDQVQEEQTLDGQQAQDAEQPQQTQDSGQTDQPQVAEACVQDMNAFAQRMNEDQFWLSGWGGGYATAMPATTAAPAGGTTGAGGTAVASDPAGVAVDPRAQVEGIVSPRYQVRTLYGAAQVLAQRGDQEGCEFLVARMNEIYDDYSQTLQDAGVDPASVTTWRQEQLALAEPLVGSEGRVSYRIDDITGTDVRNMQDESLGSVNDVIIDPTSGTAAYLIVARGGFLGMGTEYYAVPWDQVAATPGLATIVLDRTEAEIEQAPTVDPDRLRNPTTMGEERNATDAFWTDRG